MRTVTHLSDEKERLNFATRAAAYFAEHPDCTAYTAGDVVQGEWFAVRWGMGNDCVLTFRISEEDPVTVYQQAIEAKA